MSLADILAKKKAASVQANPAPVQEAAKEQPVDQTGMVAAFEEVKLKPGFTGFKEATDTPLKTNQEVAATQVEKPLTFTEKMALKRLQAAQPNIGSTPSPTTAPQTPVNQAVLVPVAENNGIDASVNKVETADSQAYSDIAERIKALGELSDLPLEGAMKDLKKALLANPNACALLLDSDYGAMVVALKRMTKEDQIEAAKEKTTGKKSKKIDFSNPEEVEAVFNEL